MASKYYTIQEIIEWYKLNTNVQLPSSLLQHMIDDGMITRLPNKRYSLSEVHNFFLQKEDCEYLKNEEGKFIFKESRLNLFDKYKVDETKDNGQYTITKLQGNKLKLIKK